MDIKDGNANFAVRSIVKSVNKKYADGNGNIDIDSIVKKLSVNISEANLSRNGYVRFTNGFQICWGQGSGTWCGFAKAFPVACFVVIATNNNGDSCLGRKVEGIQNNGFNTYAGGHGNSHWDANGTGFNYVAIGI